MSLPIDAGNATPTQIQEFDGFDVQTIDSNRWNTPTIEGSTGVIQTGGELVFSNNGAGTKGISFLETIRKFGKNWRISTDLQLATTTGVSGELSLVLYKSATCYVKIGPYKKAGINCDCYLRYKNGSDPETGVALTGNVVNTTYCSTYTFAIISDTILIYYMGVIATSIPMGEMFNYTIRIEAGTGANADTLVAKANDYEIRNNIDTLLITIGQLVKDMHDTIGAGIATQAVLTDIDGDIVLSDTTEVFLTFDQATYGTKFKVNMFADLEDANVENALFSTNGGAVEDITIIANNLISNSIKLCKLTGAVVGDCIYIQNSTRYNRLDVYMEGGTSNTDNVYVWEYYDGANWAALGGVVDGTLHNGKVFGKSGSVTWTSTLEIPPGWASYPIRATITTAGSSRPKATHLQVSLAGATGFDSNAAFLSNLMVRVYRKRGDGSYATMPVDMALPFTQCILYRNLEISDVPAWTDIKIGFKLSAAPTAEITIPYTGFVETIET